MYCFSYYDKNCSEQNTITQISAEIQISKLLQQINPEIKSPLVSIFISGFQIEIDDFDLSINKYEEERDETTEKVFENIKKYPQLNISKNNFKIILFFKHNFAKEPDHNDFEVKLY